MPQSNRSFIGLISDFLRNKRNVPNYPSIVRKDNYHSGYVTGSFAYVFKDVYYTPETYATIYQNTGIEIGYCLGKRIIRATYNSHSDEPDDVVYRLYLEDNSVYDITRRMMLEAPYYYNGLSGLLRALGLNKPPEDVSKNCRYCNQLKRKDYAYCPHCGGPY